MRSGDNYLDMHREHPVGFPGGVLVYLIPCPHFDFNMDELSQFCRRQAERGISLKSSLIEYALRRRGIRYTRPNTRLLLCEIGGRPATFFLMNGPSSSVGIRTICDNKWVSRKLFSANGLAVARSAAFGRNALEEALKHARSKIGYPLVIKPNSASRGTEWSLESPTTKPSERPGSGR